MSGQGKKREKSWVCCLIIITTRCVHVGERGEETERGAEGGRRMTYYLP